MPLTIHPVPEHESCVTSAGREAFTLRRPNSTSLLVGDHRGGVLATVVFNPAEPDGRALAEEHARLFAVAPDLLAALEAIVDCYGVGTRDPAKVVANLTDFIEEGRAAIARAKGGGS